MWNIISIRMDTGIAYDDSGWMAGKMDGIKTSRDAHFNNTN